MRNSKWHKWLCIGIVIAAFLCLGIWFSIRPPFWLYRAVITAPHELPSRFARPAFRLMIEGWELPGKTENLRVVFSGGRDYTIFATFQTDSAGTSYVREQLASQGFKLTPYSGHPLTSHFSRVSLWQDQSEVRILDEETFVESGLSLKYRQDHRVRAIIVADAQHNKWYVFAKE